MKRTMKNSTIIFGLLVTFWLVSGCVYVIPEHETPTTPTRIVRATDDTCEPMAKDDAVQIAFNFTDVAGNPALINPTMHVYRNDANGDQNTLRQSSAAAYLEESSFFACDDFACQIMDRNIPNGTTGYTIAVERVGYLTTTTTIGLATHNGCPLAQQLNVTLEPLCPADRPIGILPLRLLDANGQPVENGALTYRTGNDATMQEADCVTTGYDGYYFCEIAVTGPITTNVTINAEIQGDRVAPRTHNFELAINENQCLYQPAEWQEEIQFADACGVTPPSFLILLDTEGAPYDQPTNVSITADGASFSYEEIDTSCVDEKANGACARYQLDLPKAGAYTIFARSPGGLSVATRTITVPSAENGCMAATAPDTYTMFMADGVEQPASALLTNDPTVCQVDQQIIPATLRLYLPPDQSVLPVTLATQIGATPLTSAVACTTKGMVAQCDFTVPHPITENVTAQIVVGEQEARDVALASFDWFRCTEEGISTVQGHSFSVGSFYGGMTLMGGGCDNMCYSVADPTHLFFELYLDQPK